MKHRVFFYLLELYIIAAFFWWTYSLIKLNNEKYDSRIEILQVQTNEAFIQLVSIAENGGFVTPGSDSFYLNQKPLVVDSSRLQSFINDNYKGLKLKLSNDSNFIQALRISVDPAEVQKLQAGRNKKQRMYVYEGVFFLVIISWGVYWVFRSFTSRIELNTQQNNFLLSVTHELKTPLAAAKLMLQTLIKRDLPKEQQQKLLADSEESLNRLNDLVENMLVATQIEGKRYSYRPERLNLSELIAEIAEPYRNKAGLLLRVDIQPDIYIDADRMTLRLVFSNLIENAVKYSASPANIAIALFRTMKGCIVHVKDQGAGIPESERKNIFRKFYRIGNEETRQSKGTGLGLYIVQQVLKNHGASIQVRDNEPRGSIFEIEFKSRDN